MNYPLITEYIEAIKAAEDTFKVLKNLRPVIGVDGKPVFSSGNFAVVFKMKDERTGKLHAVKCFLKEQIGRAESYHMITEELEYISSTFLTPIEYFDKELFVDNNTTDETEFPILLMDWVEGETLDNYIHKHIDNQYELSQLAYQFSRLAIWLLSQPFAHGDLKPDNILVKDDGALVLVDYDGMYVPAMEGQKARELGSPGFRHPSRTENDFDEHIDDFSLISILLSLKAISIQPELLKQYGAPDRLLLSEKDYCNITDSKVLDAIKGMMYDAELASLYSLFILANSHKDLSQVSSRLLHLDKPDRTNIVESNSSLKLKDLAYTQIKQCANKLLLGLEVNINDINKELLSKELIILSAASVSDIMGKKTSDWLVFIIQKIFADYLSINEVKDFDRLIVNNTPGMCENPYTTYQAISLAEFEKSNGPISFFKGKINAYPFDDSFWGEFINANGKKQIVYVDQGFQGWYNLSELKDYKQRFGIVEVKNGNETVYCLKEIEQSNSMLPSYINERLTFYKESIECASSNQKKKEAYIFQIFNALTNEVLNIHTPDLWLDYLSFNDGVAINDETGEEYQYNTSKMERFSTCITDNISILKLELNELIVQA